MSLIDSETGEPILLSPNAKSQRYSRMNVTDRQMALKVAVKNTKKKQVLQRMATKESLAEKKLRSLGLEDSVMQEKLKLSTEKERKKRRDSANGSMSPRKVSILDAEIGSSDSDDDAENNANGNDAGNNVEPSTKMIANERWKRRSIRSRFGNLFRKHRDSKVNFQAATDEDQGGGTTESELNRKLNAIGDLNAISVPVLSLNADSVEDQNKFARLGRFADRPSIWGSKDKTKGAGVQRRMREKQSGSGGGGGRVSIETIQNMAIRDKANKRVLRHIQTGIADKQESDMDKLRERNTACTPTHPPRTQTVSTQNYSKSKIGFAILLKFYHYFALSSKITKQGMRWQRPGRSKKHLRRVANERILQKIKITLFSIKFTKQNKLHYFFEQ